MRREDALGDWRTGRHAVPRLRGLADATRRAYAADLRDFAGWYGNGRVEAIDVRVLADYAGRPRPRPAGGKLAPSTRARRLSAVRALLRFALGPGTSRHPARAQARPPASRRAEGGGGRGDHRGGTVSRAEPWRSGTARCSSSSTRRGCEAPRRSGSTSATSTSSRSTSTSARARARRSGSSRSARRPPHWVARYLREARP